MSCVFGSKGEIGLEKRGYRGPEAGVVVGQTSGWRGVVGDLMPEGPVEASLPGPRVHPTSWRMESYWGEDCRPCFIFGDGFVRADASSKIQTGWNFPSANRYPVPGKLNAVSLGAILAR